jgi:DNA-binding response OmpR family regulator
MDPPKKILIADDDKALLFAFNTVFRHPNYSIDSSDSVEQAKNLINQNDYKLVITDLHFTENEPEGGKEIIRYMRKKSPVPLIILLSAFEVDEGKPGSEETRPDYYLQKPVKSEAIKEIMQKNGII